MLKNILHKKALLFVTSSFFLSNVSLGTFFIPNIDLGRPNGDLGIPNGRTRRVKKAWIPGEDALLLALVETYGAGKWAKIARGIPGKTPHQCREHWFNIAPGINRNKWTTGEDEKLLALVEAHGAGNWVLIAKGLSGRTSLQCRYRYYRYLRLSQGFAPNGDPDAAPVASGQQVETLRFPSLPVDEDSDAASGQQVETYPFSSLLVDEDSNAASGQQEEAYLFLSPPVDGDFLPIRY